MKALFIGGTGTISSAITQRVSRTEGWELYLINRGHRNAGLPKEVKTIVANINHEEEVSRLIEGMEFDVVCDFIGFEKAQLERDYRLFRGRMKQFMYISSASAYQKPLASPFITEGTTLANPYWEYSRRKIECEDYLMTLYREEGFPITIVRPSHTYCERTLPVSVRGTKGAWQVIKRMREGKPILVHGDGTSLWTVTHSTDFAKAFVGLMGNVHAIGETFHITSDESLTWNQIHGIIAGALGVEYNPYYVSSAFLAEVGKPFDFRGSLLGDKANTVIFDNTKVKAAVPDFVCTTPFYVGARQSIEYFLTHPEMQVDDPEFDAWCDRLIDALEHAKRQLG